MSKQNDQRPEDRQKEREFRKELHDEQQMLQHAFDDQGRLSRGWLEELLDVDDLTERLQENTVKKLRGVVNRQLFLSNLTDAETHDARYWLEVQKLKVLGSHPPQESTIRGPLRAVLYDDPDEDLYPLSQDERIAINQIFNTLERSLTRSREGFERKQLNTNIARTEREDTEDDDGNGGRLTGLFSR